MAMLPLFLLLVLQTLDGVAGPEAILADIPHVTIRPYVIDDRVSRSLRNALREGRMATPTGERVLIRTTWRYYWRWQSDENGQCDPATATAEYRIDVALPTLSPAARFSDEDRARWPAFVAEITTYERQRMLIVAEGRIKAEAAMKAAVDCASMEAAARSAAEAVKDASLAYDEAQRPWRQRLIF